MSVKQTKKLAASIMQRQSSKPRPVPVQTNQKAGKIAVTSVSTSNPLQRKFSQNAKNTNSTQPASKSFYQNTYGRKQVDYSVYDRLNPRFLPGQPTGRNF